jgi:hypothetical protein
MKDIKLDRYQVELLFRGDITNGEFIGKVLEIK